MTLLIQIARSLPAAAAVFFAGALFAQTPYSPEDLLRADGFGVAVVSPDGSRAVSIRAWIDTESLEERRALWMVDGEPSRARAMETGQPDAREPLFSPDGKRVFFLSTRARPEGWKATPASPPYSEPALDIWQIPAEGEGEVIPLAGREKPYGRVYGDRFYGRAAFSPDGRRLVFVADDGRDVRSPAEIEAKVAVVRPDQGEGYTGFGPAHIWVAHLADEPGEYAAERIDRLTEDAFWYGDPQWSPDGKTIVVHANRTRDQESVRYSINKNYDLWAIDVATREIRQLTKGAGPEVSPRFSPDGSRLACLSSPRLGPHADVFNLVVVGWKEEEGAMRTVFDFRSPDVDPIAFPAPPFPLPRDCWEDEREVVYGATAGLESRTMSVDVDTGEVAALTREEEESDGYFERRARARTMRPASVTERPKRLSASSEVVRWDNGEGLEIEGVLVRPPAEIAQPPYKLIVNPHGGPHSRAGLGAGQNDQVLAAEGYAIFKPNFRGSAGYGLAFLDADRGDFGGGDMRDILSGVDFLIGEKLADADRLFVYGVSYGGYMTSWLVGQTCRFRAAVAENAVTDLTMMWTLSDLQSWTEWEFGGRPWEVPDAMRAHSPLTYAGRVETPTLVLHSREDRRCPLPMGRAFHQALRMRGVPTKLVIYPDEGHAIRQPRHRVDRLRRILAWFDTHGR